MAAAAPTAAATATSATDAALPAKARGQHNILLNPIDIKGEEKKNEKREARMVELPVTLKDHEWSLEMIEKQMQMKIEQHTSKRSDQFRQIFRLFREHSKGLTQQTFTDLVARFGIILSDENAKKLFARYDIDGNGLIDLHEFVHGLMPGDHNEEELMSHWAHESERKAQEAREVVKAGFNPTISELPASVQKYRWSIDEIERRLQHKIEQRTSKRSDQFRQAFRMFDKNVSLLESCAGRRAATGVQPCRCRVLECERERRTGGRRGAQLPRSLLLSMSSTLISSDLLLLLVLLLGPTDHPAVVPTSALFYLHLHLHPTRP